MPSSKQCPLTICSFHEYVYERSFLFFSVALFKCLGSWILWCHCANVVPLICENPLFLPGQVPNLIILMLLTQAIVQAIIQGLYQYIAA